MTAPQSPGNQSPDNQLPSASLRTEPSMSLRMIGIVFYIFFSVLVTWQTIALTRDWTLQRLHQQGSDELLQVITQIRAALEEYRYLPFLIAQNKDVNDLLATPFFDIRDEVSLYLEQINLVAGTSSVFVLNNDAQPLAYSHWRDEQDFFLRSHQSQRYFLQAREGHQGRQFSLNAQQQNPAYYLSSPIYDGQRFIGAAVVRVEITGLLRQLRSTGTLVLSDRHDNVFFSTGSFLHFQSLQEQLRQKDAPLSDGITANLWQMNGQQWLERSVTLDDLTWQVTILQNTQVVKRNVRNAFMLSFGTCLALGLLALLLRERQLKLRSQNETRQALARNEAQQKAIINKAQVGLLLVDPQARVTFANEMALQQFAISMPLIMEKKVTELLAGDAITPVHRVLGRLGHKGFSPLIGYESSGLRADGSEFPIMISVRRMQSHQDHRYLVTIIDISRRKKLELELHQANQSLARANLSLEQANESLEYKVQERTKALEMAQEELVQAEKLAALGRMSSAIVHELNQPLTAIRNYVAICRQMLEQPEMLAESLHVIDDLTQRMARMTTQLKIFAYKKPEQSQPVSLSMAVEQALLLFRQRLADEAVELIIEQPDSPLYIQGDSARLEQVLVNLIKNALDALQTQPVIDSPLQISSAVEPPPSAVKSENNAVHKPDLHSNPSRSSVTPTGKMIWLTVHQQQDTVVIQVQDNGPGIPDTLLPQLFDPFVTSKTIGQGLGLGLAIVQSILKDLGGQIQASNGDPLDHPEREGARFTVTLPLTELPVTERPDPEPDQP